jgi:hypothetical protein
MAVTISAAAASAAANAVVDLIDEGSANTEGKIVIMTSSGVEVATLLLSNPAFGAAANGVASANAISNDASANGGSAALFKVVDRDETEVMRGTAGTSGTDMTLSATQVGAGAIVSLSAFTYTQPQS